MRSLAERNLQRPPSKIIIIKQHSIFNPYGRLIETQPTISLKTLDNTACGTERLKGITREVGQMHTLHVYDRAVNFLSISIKAANQTASAMVDNSDCIFHLRLVC